jgi:hypothetical protein
VATALKYMEAYCSGAKPTNPDISYVVTDEDRKKLARQRIIQEKLPQKHESAINVLRARQEKDMQAKVDKQEIELKQLESDYERVKNAEEARFASDSARLSAIIEARRKRIMHRWDLKLEMWRKDWQSQYRTTLHGPLHREAWPNSTPSDGSMNPSSSLSLYTQVTV